MYRIYVKQYFQPGTINKYTDNKFHQYICPYNGYLDFNTRKEAINYLKDDILGGNWQKIKKGWSSSGTYLLSQGEYDRPDYDIRKVKQ